MGSVVAGRTHVIVEVAGGEVGFFVGDPKAWAEAVRAGENRPRAVKSTGSWLLRIGGYRFARAQSIDITATCSEMPFSVTVRGSE